MSTAQRRTLALFFPAGGLEITPVVKNLAAGLADAGFVVDLFTVRNRHRLSPQSPHRDVNLFVYPRVLQMVREPAPRTTLAFFWWVLPKCLRKRYSAYIGAGIRGLLVAAVLSRLTHVPVIYHCLELYPSAGISSVTGHIYKRLERWANRLAAHTLIQDALRAELLASDNEIRRETILQLPVSTFGPARRTPNTALRQRFGLSADRKLILCAGAILSAFVPGREMVEAAQSWPDEWALVLHSNVPFDREQLQALQAVDVTSRVVFSDTPVPYPELASLISSADIGLALYRHSDENIYNLGLSSGKLAEYLHAGLPVIASAFPGVRELIEQCGCGMTVLNAGELQQVIAVILADQERYSQASIRCFNAHLALENYMPAIDRALSECIETKYY